MPSQVADATRFPNRQQLLDQLTFANRLGWVWIFCQSLICAALVYAIDWNRVATSWLVPLVAATVMIGPSLMGLVILWAQNKTSIEQLRPNTKFGVYDKFLLQSLFQETLQRLGLPDERVPVYITADKSLNAAALSPGLLSYFLKSLHGVYLHRQMLHRLEPREVQDTLGHELGHYYRYYLVSDRFRSITLLMGALLGILIAEKTDLSDGPGVLALIFTSFAIGWLGSWPQRRWGRSIEYLCDDFGAHVHGVDVAIQSLLKLGADSEIQWAIRHEVLFQNTTAKQLSVANAMAAVEAAIPYGTISREELQAAVEKELRNKRDAEKKVTLFGFLTHAWQGDDPHDEDALREMKVNAKALDRIPRIPWESLLHESHTIQLDRTGIESLVNQIEANPNQVLFRVPDDLSVPGSTHPPVRSRILYLWNHRDAIEKTR
jgi:Zn-dependent protease with chaperone function